MANLLASEISPYLLQHQHNPVHWLPWGEAAFAKAKAEDKPVFVSIGYAACHWCHVMAHESFEDVAVAEYLNQHFICIKVDREERPDVDALYMQALQFMQVPGGWPLNMFVTPAGEPFFGGTYFPPEAKYGRPSFKQLLESIVEAWQQQRESILDYTATMRIALQKMAEHSQPQDLPSLKTLTAECERVLGHVDAEWGGLQGAPKFPQLPMWLNLLSMAKRQHHPALLQAIKLTAEALCQGGIYDHLAGGLMRYATDAHWLIPHFEKMLYDNAQFIEFLTRLWLWEQEPLYQQRVEQTISWLQQEMLTDSGAFASALDADSEGLEGKYYVWSLAEIKTVLGEESALFARAYDVSLEGNWEGHNILHRLHAASITEQEANHLPALCQTLLSFRRRRVPPACDDKVLTDWNGLLISALTHAAMVYDRHDWLQLAKTAYQAVVDKLSDGSHLYHLYRAHQRKQRGMLDDYANLIAAALRLYQASGESQYLSQACQWAETVQCEFSDQHGAYLMASQQATDLLVRVKNAQDQAYPAGNGVMAYNLVQLYYLTGKQIYQQRYEALIKHFAAELSQDAPFHGSLMQAVSLMENAVQVVILGSDQTLINAVWRAKTDELIVLPLANTQHLPSQHPAFGKQQIDNKTTIYVCAQQTCGYPISNLTALNQALQND